MGKKNAGDSPSPQAAHSGRGKAEHTRVEILLQRGKGPPFAVRVPGQPSTKRKGKAA